MRENVDIGILSNLKTSAVQYESAHFVIGVLNRKSIDVAKRVLRTRQN